MTAFEKISMQNPNQHWSLTKQFLCNIRNLSCSGFYPHIGECSWKKKVIKYILAWSLLSELRQRLHRYCLVLKPILKNLSDNVLYYLCNYSPIDLVSGYSPSQLLLLVSLKNSWSCNNSERVKIIAGNFQVSSLIMASCCDVLENLVAGKKHLKRFGCS